MEETRGDWRRLSISMGDLDIYTPEEHVMTVYETVMGFGGETD